MAKQDTQKARAGITKEQGQIDQQTGQFQQKTGADQGTSQQRATDIYSGLVPQAQGSYAAGTGGFSAPVLNKTRSDVSSVAQSGGYDPTQTNALRQGFQKQSTTPVDPAQLAGIRSTTDQFLNTGGMNQPALNTVEGGYTDMAKTGGFTPEASSAFMRQATSGVPDIYKNLEAAAAQRRAATGGLGTGGDQAQLARQLSEEQAKATTGAETSLNQQINANKLAGLGGLSSTESSLAGLRQGALGQKVNTEFGVSDRQLAGLTGASNLESNIAGGVRSGTATEAGFETGVAGQNQQTMNTLAQLFSSNDQASIQRGTQIIQSMGLDANTQAQLIQYLTSLSGRPGTFQTAFGDVLAAGGAAAGAAAGLGVKV